MNPDFGVGISRFIFEQEGVFESGAIKNRILSQVESYLPYIKISNIDLFERTDLSNTYQLTIDYFIPSISGEEKLILNLAPQDSSATGI